MFFLAQAERRSERGNETQNLFCNEAEKIHRFRGMWSPVLPYFLPLIQSIVLHLEDGDFSALRRRDCGHDRSLWICVFSWLEGMVNVLVNQFYHVETVLKRLHIKGLSNTAQGLSQFLNFSSSVYFKMNQFIEKTPLIEKMWKVILSTLVTRNLFLEDRLVRNFCFIVSLLYLKTHM